MPGPPPEGDPAPADGRLPDAALVECADRPFAVYVHVPYCTTRCGYCDFTTYTADELGTNPGASREGWAAAALSEVRLAARVLGPSVPAVDAVFFGGGTPTVLPPGDLLRVLDGIASTWGLRPDAEVTVEANPESVDRASLDVLRAGGTTRLSLGMQSAVPHVLAVLDRVHRRGRVQQAVADARDAGFANVSLDLIYGTPGESLDDWQRTLDVAVDLAPEHVSAYALVVEPGTRLAARVARGELDAPDDDLMAAMYEVADERLAAHGLCWYEISNWARGAANRCRHNSLYWSDATWWGIGPGAHSHVGGVRWWNVRHPAAWADRLAAGLSPAAGRETLNEPSRRLERIMLGLRTVRGASLDDVRAAIGEQAEQRLTDLCGQGLLEGSAMRAGRAVLTRRGRLLADVVTHRLT